MCYYLMVFTFTAKKIGYIKQTQGVIAGKHIELLHETDLPDGLQVIVDIRPDSNAVEEKKWLIDQLCGSWAKDDSLDAIFAEIEKNRRSDSPREVNFDAPS